MSSNTSSKVTTDHDQIRRWAEERGAKPSAVIRTESGDDPGILRLDFPGYSGEGSLEEIAWDEWFRKLDERNLALLYQEHTAAGKKSNFNKIVSRETAEEVESAAGARGSSSRRGRAGTSNGRSISHGTQATGQKRTSRSRSKTASAAASRQPRQQQGEEEGRQRTTNKSVSARGRGSSSGRTSTRSRANEKRSSTSRSGGATRPAEARSSRTTSRSGGRQASARSSGSSGTRAKRSSSQGSNRRSGSRSR